MVTLFPSVFDGPGETIDVDLTTIDDLALKHGPFDIWKLDIEGAEGAALRGATQTLKNAAPRAIIVELFRPFVKEFVSAGAATHSFAYRAAIRRETYELALFPWQTTIGDAFYAASPMYVFATEEQACREHTDPPVKRLNHSQ